MIFIKQIDSSLLDSATGQRILEIMGIKTVTRISWQGGCLRGR
jgi:hypothetical protein